MTTRTLSPEERERRSKRLAEARAGLTKKQLKERSKKGYETWKEKNEKALLEMRTTLSVTD